MRVLETFTVAARALVVATPSVAQPNSPPAIDSTNEPPPLMTDASATYLEQTLEDGVATIVTVTAPLEIDSRTEQNGRPRSLAYGTRSVEGFSQEPSTYDLGVRLFPKKPTSSSWQPECRLAPRPRCGARRFVIRTELPPAAV